MTLLVKDSKIQLFKLATIPRAYCTRFVHDRLVGFAVNDGNDACPTIVDWKTGKAWIVDCSRFANGEQAGNNEEAELNDGFDDVSVQSRHD